MSELFISLLGYLENDLAIKREFKRSTSFLSFNYLMVYVKML